MKWKTKKNYMGVFILFQNYGKFCSISMEHFIKHKPLIFEECSMPKHKIGLQAGVEEMLTCNKNKKKIKTRGFKNNFFIYKFSMYWYIKVISTINWKLFPIYQLYCHMSLRHITTHYRSSSISNNHFSKIWETINVVKSSENY